MQERALLVIDGSYNLEQIRSRGLEHILSIRHLDGYWPKVWSVHPIDNYQSDGEDAEEFGTPVIEAVQDGHFFVRTRFGASKLLARFGPLNFLLGQIRLILFLRKLVRKNEIGAIRASDPLLCGLLGLVVSRLTGTKLMIRINGNNDDLREKSGLPIMPRLFRSIRFEHFVERLTLSRADIIIAPSENYIEFAVSKGADISKCRKVRYGNLIDPRHLEEAADRQPLADPKLNEKPFLLCIGRLETLKMPEDCIRVLADVVEQGFDVNFSFVGDGSERENLLKLANELGVEERIHFWGNRNQEFLSRITPMAACVLSPLTGRALTEVAFGEAPIVAYDLDWQRDLVIDGISGFLVPGYDVSAMSQSTMKVLKSPDLAAQLGTGARKRAFELLEPDKQTLLEIAAYDEMLGEAGFSD